MKLLKACAITLFLLTLMIGGLLLKTYYDAGEFKEIKTTSKGKCQLVSGVLSSEDIAIDRKTGIAFISSTDWRNRWSSDEKAGQGAIYGLDLNRPGSELIHFTANFTKEFNPHGIGLWRGEDGILLLFVVNHSGGGHFVEIFEQNGGNLIHRESISGALMHSPNDVVPTGSRTFYVTNDHGNTTEFGRMIEEYLQLARSFVLYYDGDAFQTVAEGLAYANGINLSPDGGTVYAAATVGQEVLAYEREKQTGKLTLRDTISLGTGPDNIDVDENGNLWIGCHPKLLTFVKYSKDPEQLSPSHVIKVAVREPGEYRVEEVFLSNGETLSGSSVAAVFEDTLLIGSVFDNGFLRCRFP